MACAARKFLIWSQQCLDAGENAKSIAENRLAPIMSMVGDRFKRDEVYRQIHERIDVFNRDRDFVFDTIHNVQRPTSVENLMAMFRANREAECNFAPKRSSSSIAHIKSFFQSTETPGASPHANWSRTLTEISRQPLALCPDFSRTAARFEAWWNNSVLDRPILMGTANTDPARPITRRLELLGDPDAWFKAKTQDLGQLRLIGDSLPHVRIDFGACMLSSLLGGKTEISHDTTWTHAFLNNDWSNAPDWSVRQEHPWWKALDQLMALVSADARGRYLVCTPNMGAALDVLLNFRGSTELCLDSLDQPEIINSSAKVIALAHAASQHRLYAGIAGRGAGLIHWLQLWSDQPYVVAECDFSFMLGPEQYDEVCRPDITRQSRIFGRTVYHLDGPGSARHIDALLEIPSIQAIQFTPGEGTPSALAWVKMFQKIQQTGRSLLIFSPPGEALKLFEALQPEGLAISVGNSSSVRELETLWTQFERRYS